MNVSRMVRRAPFLAMGGLVLGACNPGCSKEQARQPATAATGPDSLAGKQEQEQEHETPDSQPQDEYAEERKQLLATLRAEGIEDPRVLQAISDVPRHELVPEAQKPHAYENRPLPIGKGQTISQPYIVALMTSLADVQPGERVLEIGTGSGYQAAVLSKLAGELYTIEIVEHLGKRAKRDLERLGLVDNVHFKLGDGYAGWPEAAPFDAIVVTAAPPKIPEPLKEQLKVGGRLVIPVGGLYQDLRVLENTEEGLKERDVIPVRFVPMTGKAQER